MDLVGRLKKLVGRPQLVGRPLRRVRAGDGRLAAHELAPKLEPTLSVTSPDFEDGAPLPRSATADGTGTPPTLVVADVPPEAKSLVVVCEDPDAPMPHPFLHWTVFWLGGRDMTIDPKAVMEAGEGKNSHLEIGYAPASPPPGHGAHHYHFQVLALDDVLPGSPEAMPSWEGEQAGEGVAVGAGRSELFEEMRGHVIAWGEIIGTYER